MMWLWLAQTAAMGVLLLRAWRAADRWRHQAAVASVRLDVVLRQAGGWVCGCGDLVSARPVVSGGVLHDVDACTPLDEL